MFKDSEHIMRHALEEHPDNMQILNHANFYSLKYFVNKYTKRLNLSQKAEAKEEPVSEKEIEIDYH